MSFLDISSGKDLRKGAIRKDSSRKTASKKISTSASNLEAIRKQDPAPNTNNSVVAASSFLSATGYASSSSLAAIKLTTKTTNAQVHTTDSNNSLVQQAQIQRQHRERDRNTLRAVETLQRFIRGFLSRCRTHKELLNDFDRKMADIVKFSDLFRLQNRNIPTNIIIALTTKLLFALKEKAIRSYDSENLRRLSVFFLNVIIPSQQDHLCCLGKSKIMKLIRYVMTMMTLDKTSFILMKDLEEALQIFLMLHDISSESGRFIRVELTDNTNDLFILVRECLTLIYTPLMNSKIANDKSSGGEIGESNIIVDSILNCVILLCSCDDACSFSRWEKFCYWLMSAPLSFWYLSKSKMSRMILDVSFVQALEKSCTSTISNKTTFPEFPASDFPEFTSYMFFTANLFALSSSMLDLADENQENQAESSSLLGSNLPDESLLVYFQICEGLLPPLVSIFGGESVFWFTDGSKRSSVMIPSALRNQILSITNALFLKQCINRILLPVSFDIDEVLLKEYENQKKEVSNCMKEDGVSIAAKALEKQKKENGGIFHMLDKAGKAFKSTFRSFRSLMSSSSDEKSKGYLENSGPAKNSLHKENVLLVKALLRIWVIIFPTMRLGTYPGSDVLADIVFTTSVISKLWILLPKFSTEPDEFVNMCENDENKEQVFYANFLPSVLIILLTLLNTALFASDETEIYEGKPLQMYQYFTLIKYSKSLLGNLLRHNPSVLSSKNRGNQNNNVARTLVCFISDMYRRWSRRPFCSYDCWIDASANEQSFQEMLNIVLLNGTRVHPNSYQFAVLRVMPFSISFFARLHLFRSVLEAEKKKLTTRPGAILRIRRKYVLQDSMRQMDKFTHDKRIQIQFVNDFGEDEAGIDAGGLIKDFLLDLSSILFNPNYGLFAQTKELLLYPNPNSGKIYEHGELQKLYEFLGRVMGKSLRENITVQPQFAPFFLDPQPSNMLQDLKSLDEDIYKSMIFIKNYVGDIRDLSLVFTVASGDDDHKEIDLIAGGKNVEVNNSNKIRYVNLVAKHYAYERIKQMNFWFFSGLYEIVPKNLLSMFCSPELHILISGCSSINIDDWKDNCKLRGYSSTDKNVTRFWKVVEDLDDSDKKLLLKFITACERPPSLGFSDMQPPFSIQRVECDDNSRLPTASTCFNVLKLPNYSSKEKLREKLIVAIRSESGFELS